LARRELPDAGSLCHNQKIPIIAPEPCINPMPRKPSGAATPAIRDLEKRGIRHLLHVYDFEPGDLGIGEQAALALGIDAARMFKTLISMIDGRQLVVALTPVLAETQMKALAAALGGKRAAMASVDDAERATGYVKGGISPFGQRQKLPVAIDRSALNHDRIYVNGGRRGLQIELAPDDLIKALEAKLADLAR
jgi:Cys-tRNA(Pro)/Cys-tRNA(Cys) deacylase